MGKAYQLVGNMTRMFLLGIVLYFWYQYAWLGPSTGAEYVFWSAAVIFTVVIVTQGVRYGMRNEVDEEPTSSKALRNAFVILMLAGLMYAWNNDIKLPIPSPAESPLNSVAWSMLLTIIPITLVYVITQLHKRRQGEGGEEEVWTQ